jgi:hypothetical protein
MFERFYVLTDVTGLKGVTGLHVACVLIEGTAPKRVLALPSKHSLSD